MLSTPARFSILAIILIWSLPKPYISIDSTFRNLIKDKYSRIRGVVVYPNANDRNIVAQGKVQDLIDSKDSITGKFLSGEMSIEVPEKRREIKKGYIHLIGCKEHNIENIDIAKEMKFDYKQGYLYGKPEKLI